MLLPRTFFWHAKRWLTCGLFLLYHNGLPAIVSPLSSTTGRPTDTRSVSNLNNQLESLMFTSLRRYAIIVAAITALPLQAAAQTVFTVQLGNFQTEQQARAHWKTLSNNFPDLFSALNYAPDELVSRNDDFVTYRTQAGPIATRSEARAICDEVIAQGYECLVAETAMFFTDDETIRNASSGQASNEDQNLERSDTRSGMQFQDVSKLPEPAPQAQRGATHAAPIQTGPADDLQNAPAGDEPRRRKETASPEVAGNASRMNVEEAIPVPLSGAPEHQRNPYIERGNIYMESGPSNTISRPTFWADIGYFRSSTAAAQYVRVLKSRDEMLPSKLRIRITRPYGVTSGTERLSLRLGPFLSTRPIRRLCALTRPENLRCKAIKDLGESIEATTRYDARNRRNANRAGSASGRAYQSYRQRRQAYKRHSSVTSQRAGMSRPASLTGSSRPEGNVHIMLGSFLSRRAASDKWQELESRYPTLLGAPQRKIEAPDNSRRRRRLYRLKAGPFASASSARYTCGQLKQRGTLCLVVSR